MVVRTNTLALNSHRNLGMTGLQQARSSARLSSGFRINSAADDAAGLGISETMRAQIRGLNQASRNAQDGISLIQTAEGALGTVNEMVVRIRELVVQSGNDTNTDDDRNRIQDEINQLTEEITEVAHRTEFNTMSLFSGENGLLDRIVADHIDPATISNAEEAQQFARFLNAINQFNTASGWDLTLPTDGSEADAARDAIAALIAFDGTAAGADALDGLVTAAGGTMVINIGGVERDWASIDHSNVSTAQESADLAAFLNGLTGFSNGLAGGSEFTFQIGANSNQQITVNIASMSWEGIARGGAVGIDLDNALVAAGSDIDDILDGLDATLAVVTAQRSELGAVQNRLEFTIENLDVAAENLSAAESRIRDADMAMEMMRLTQANVLQQAATAMLAQANQAPQSILQLLG